MNGNVLPPIGIAISGFRYTGRTELFKKLKLVLPNAFRGCDFEFLENPFSRLPHPLMWDGDDRKYSLSRTLGCWADFEELIKSQWFQAVRDNKIPVMDGCGLDVVLYALARARCEKDEEEVLKLHHLLVDWRIKAQGLDAPYYIITRAETSVLAAYLAQKVKNKGVSLQAATAFIEREIGVVKKYFAVGNGQKPPHYLDPRATQEQMLQSSISHIGMLLGATAQK